MRQPVTLVQLLHCALALHREERFEEAERLYRRMLDIAPGDFNARHLLGVARHQRGCHQEALELIGGALKAKADSSPALAHYSLVLQALGRREEALTSLEKALSLAPGSADLLSRRGNLLWQMSRGAEALASYEAALKLQPRHVDALNNRGVLLESLGRHSEALDSLDQALAVMPDHAEALSNRGNVLRRLKRSEEALESYDRAIRSQPSHAEAWSNRGAVLWELKDMAGALASLERAAALKPGHAEILLNRGIVLREHRRLGEALASLDAAVAADPRNGEALYQRAQTLQMMDRPAEAAAGYQTALAMDSKHARAAGGLLSAAMQLCDWPRVAHAAEALRDTEGAVEPLVMLAYSDEPALHLECARRHVENKIGGPQWSAPRAAVREKRIRLAYLSADYKEHATAYLTAELFERHDRSRFEILGMSLGPDDGSAMRARLARAFDQFHDARFLSDRKAAELLATLGVDVLIDLNGHTYGARPEILAHRPAPVQVNFLGYPGTIGAGFIDYIIADETVLPAGQQAFYVEKIVHLPHCYQVNAAREVAQVPPSRQACGLPETGFVFCCFNNCWKIGPGLFDIWMRLLTAVPGSVLWLLAGEENARANLRREAAARGIDPQRLVFAGRASQADHLVRHCHADLFLDTLPYNAHTTASDALWMGLPVVTCMGKSFAGRVAASLVGAAGVPGLATQCLADYEALALRLAREPVLLRSFRDRLQRKAGSLFDSVRFCRSLEAAYVRMTEIARSGEPPRGFGIG
ncbi:MAG TPA: tetratricopeptide repeat protein [Rhizomicrobium sp.]|nr:tetratricopeptide repeat protein [Rhizomicrobium sp.]